MTRDDLRSLGMSDDQLADEHHRLFGVRPAIAKRHDSAETQARRGVVFDAVTIRWTSPMPIGNAKAGAFAADDPETHAAFGAP